MEERAALERRRQAQEDIKAARARNDEAAETGNDTSVLDDLLNKLRNGDVVTRKSRRARPTANQRITGPLSPSLPNPENGDAVDIAKDMLEALKSDGFVATPSSPRPERADRLSKRARLRGTVISLESDLEGPLSPTSPSSQFSLDDVTIGEHGEIQSPTPPSVREVTPEQDAIAEETGEAA